MILTYVLIGWVVTLGAMGYLSVKSGQAPMAAIACAVMFIVWPLWLVVIAYVELINRGEKK